MAKQSSIIERIFMFDEASVFKPMLSGFLIGAALSFITNKNVAMAVGGGIGGAFIFTIIWKIGRIVKND